MRACGIILMSLLVSMSLSSCRIMPYKFESGDCIQSNDAKIKKDIPEYDERTHRLGKKHFYVGIIYDHPRWGKEYLLYHIMENDVKPAQVLDYNPYSDISEVEEYFEKTECPQWVKKHFRE